MCTFAPILHLFTNCSFLNMRTYAQKKHSEMSKQLRQRVNFKKREYTWEKNTRMDTEWDIRIDITDECPLNHIIDTLKLNDTAFEYVMVSGLENPDNEAFDIKGSTGVHVHIALVTRAPSNRDRVLQMCRGSVKLSDEYAVPRKRTYSYAGWYLHHAKVSMKLDPKQRVSYERGLLPLDGFTDAECKQVVRMCYKFAEQEDMERFQPWYDVLHPSPSTPSTK